MKSRGFKSAKIDSRLGLALTVWALGLGSGALSGCSGTPVNPLPALPTPPEYVSVPHPEGLDYGDLLAIFTDPKAPSPDSLKECDKDFQKLQTATQSKDEIQQGVVELVKSDPSQMHWCFYAKMLELEAAMKKLDYIDERQKKVLDTYVFFTPVARAFYSEHQDSRYMRWAIHRYKTLSDNLFYRKLDVTPQMNAEMAGVASPLGSMRVDKAGQRSVLERYGIAKPVAKASPIAPPAGVPLAPSELGVDRVPETPLIEADNSVNPTVDIPAAASDEMVPAPAVSQVKMSSDQMPKSPESGEPVGPVDLRGPAQVKDFPSGDLGQPAQ